MRFSALFFSTALLICSACNVNNNVKEDASLATYFNDNQVTGCFAIMNNATGQFTTYNLARYRDSSYSPASTFKIINSLIGLQTGVISNDSMVIKWDRVTRDIQEWNKDLSMYEAFQVSALPYYQEVARRIGKDTMTFWLDSLKYGLRSEKDSFRIRTAVDSFWLDNSLKISADAQVWLVKMLYFKQLPFRASVQEQVKRMMIKENNTIYQLAYKTGWGKTDSGNELGWIIGWIEENRHVYFFAMNLESSDHTIDMKRVREKILKNILTKQGFFQGKM